MSDTVELIIEIPKDIYERCKDYKLWSYDAETLEGAVATSKPLSESKGEWIPVSSVEEMPKECLWVTHKGADYAYVEMIGWDSQRECRTEDGGFRCDSDRLKDIVAYMPYSEPEPYKEGGNE